MKTWLKTLEIKNNLDKDIKARTMIYQVCDKEEVAALLGLKLNYFYHFSRKDWRQVQSNLNRLKDRALMNFHSKNKIKEFKGMSGKTPYGKNLESLF